MSQDATRNHGTWHTVDTIQEWSPYMPSRTPHYQSQVIVLLHTTLIDTNGAYLYFEHGKGATNSLYSERPLN